MAELACGSMAAKAVQRELDRRGWSRNYLAAKLGTTSASISRYMRGLREPPYSLMVEAERLLGVPTKLWLRRAA